MVAIIVALVTLSLTILGLVIKLTSFTTEIRVWVEEMRKEMKGDRRLIRRIPIIEFRVAFLEKHLEISAPRMMVHESSDDDGDES